MLYSNVGWTDRRFTQVLVDGTGRLNIRVETELAMNKRQRTFLR